MGSSSSAKAGKATGIVGNEQYTTVQYTKTYLITFHNPDDDKVEATQTLREKYKIEQTFTQEEFTGMVNKVGKGGKIFDERFWMPIMTPSKLKFAVRWIFRVTTNKYPFKFSIASFQCVIMVNDPTHGTMHCFLKYHSKLIAVLPRFHEATEIMGTPFVKVLKKLQKKKKKKKRKKILKNFQKIMKKQDKELKNSRY